MIIQKTSDGIILSVKVIPKSRRDEIVGKVGESLKVKLTQAPERGKANKALIELLARVLNLRKSDIVLIKGEAARNKLLKIKGITVSEIKRTFKLD